MWLVSSGNFSRNFLTTFVSTLKFVFIGLVYLSKDQFSFYVMTILPLSIIHSVFNYSHFTLKIAVTTQCGSNHLFRVKTIRSNLLITLIMCLFLLFFYIRIQHSTVFLFGLFVFILFRFFVQLLQGIFHSFCSIFFVTFTVAALFFPCR